ncbi:MAG: YbaN family protein [Bacteroidales bacterium]|jgi:uncharacterized membrane protein YbaN (DUF454 family)|nr:YbaN family protein [Bacteroidales bacterium]
MRNTVLITAGSLALALAIAGIFLPLLPTVPFVLLAASCYLKASPRLYRWLTSHPLFGKIILDYKENKIIPLRAKIYTIVLLWVSIGVSIFLVSVIWVRILLLLIAAGVSIHVLSFKSGTKNND